MQCFQKYGAGDIQLNASQYIITQVETLRPAFQAVAEGYREYYDPDWRTEMVEGEE